MRTYIVHIIIIYYPLLYIAVIGSSNTSLESSLYSFGTQVVSLNVFGMLYLGTLHCIQFSWNFPVSFRALLQAVRNIIPNIYFKIYVTENAVKFKAKF